MPTSPRAEAQPFALSGMGDLLKETKPDLAAEFEAEIPEPPQPVQDDEPEGGVAADDQPKPDESKADDAATPSEDELKAEQERQAKESDEKKKQDETAAAEKAEKTKQDEEARKKAEADAAANQERDRDLKDNLSPHLHKSTRKVIEEWKAKIVTERNARESERKESAAKLEELTARLTAAEERAKSVKIPKETEDELKTLRERVRELDITKDPEIENKYDKKIAANNESAIKLLISFGVGKAEDPNNPGKYIDNPQVVDALKRNGLTLRALQPYIAALDEKGLVDEAEYLREVVRENNRLARDRQAEVETWKADYDGRVKIRTEKQQLEAQEQQKVIDAQRDKILSSDIAALAKDFPYLNQPEAPKDGDSPAVAKTKQAAIDEYNTARKQIEDALKMMSPAGLPPEKAAEALGRYQASAIQGVIFRQHLLPRVLKELNARAARITELETQLGKVRGAGNLSRQHAAAVTKPAGEITMPGKDVPIQDAIADFAKQMGVSVG